MVSNLLNHNMKRSQYILILIFSFIVGCSRHSNCTTLGCPDLSPGEVDELNENGVTLSEFSTKDIAYNNRDGLAVIEFIKFDLLPVAGTEDVNLQIDSIHNLDFEVSRPSYVRFRDVNGNILDEGNYPTCWDTSFPFTEEQDNTVVAAVGRELVPDGMNFILQTALNCVPAAATGIIHEYTRTDGSIDIVLDVDLAKLENWRKRVIPLICKNQEC